MSSLFSCLVNLKNVSHPVRYMSFIHHSQKREALVPYIKTKTFLCISVDCSTCCEICVTEAAMPTGKLLALNNVVPVQSKKRNILYSINTTRGACCEKLQVPQTPFRETCPLLKFSKINGYF
jgi:hypothetical protein